jgi:phosphoribosylcarboxyaminoimidazole (NCAIR) mutase
MAETADVAILMGSRSDWEIMKSAADTLREFGVSCDALVERRRLRARAILSEKLE